MITSIRPYSPYQTQQAQKSKAINNKTTSSPSFSIISFSGNKKNPKQLAFISIESVPLNKNGGMADVVGELPPNLIKEGYDTRVIVPLLNAPDGVRKKNGKPIYVSPKGKEFTLKDLNTSFDYKYGIKSASAKIYKVDDDRVKYPAYVIHCPETISKNKTEYQGWIMDQMNNQSSFCKAGLESIKRLNNETENFNPKFVMTHDWSTTMALEYMDQDPYFKDAKKIHSILNLGQLYQGMMAPPVAAPYLVSEKELDRINHDEKMKDIIVEINRAVNSRAGSHRNICLNKELEKGDFKKAYVKIAENYERYIPYTTNHLGFLDQRTRELYPDKTWYQNIYNASAVAIKKADGIVTCSDEYLKDIQKEEIYTGGLSDLLNLAKLKSYGITIGMDYDLNNPETLASENPKAVKYPFSVDSKKVDPEKGIYDFKTGKLKNKLHLQEQLSTKSFDTNKQNKHYNFKQYGHLKKDKNAMLSVFITRFDPLQKGVDVAVDSASKFLEENKNAQIILAGPNFDTDKALIKQYVDKVVEKNPGRAVLCNGYIDNINQFYAASDTVMIPSRFAPFELVQLLGMRMGSVPIVSSSGGLREVIIDETHPDKKKALGFKTAKSLILEDDPVKEYTHTLQRAMKVYNESPEKWNQLTENCLKYRLDWSGPAKKYTKTVFNTDNYPNIKDLYSANDKLCAGGKLDIYDDVTKTSDLGKNLNFLKNKGIGTIINIGKENKKEEQKALAKGFDYHNIPVEESKLPSIEKILKIFNIIDNSKNATFIEHDKKNTSSFISMLYSSFKDGLKPEKAKSKFEYSLDTKPFEGFNNEELGKGHSLLDAFSNLGEKVKHKIKGVDVEKIKQTMHREIKPETFKQIRQRLIDEYHASKNFFDLVRSGQHYI